MVYDSIRKPNFEHIDDYCPVELSSDRQRTDWYFQHYQVPNSFKRFHRDTLRRWLRERREGKYGPAKVRRASNYVIPEIQINYLIDLIENREQSCMYLKEMVEFLRERYDVIYSTSTIARTLHARDYTYKHVEEHARERDPVQRYTFRGIFIPQMQM